MVYSSYPVPNPVYAQRHDRPWTVYELFRLYDLASSETETRMIATILDRSEHAVRDMASKFGISLMPKDPGPFSGYLATRAWG